MPSKSNCFVPTIGLVSRGNISLVSAIHLLADGLLLGRAYLYTNSTYTGGRVHIPFHLPLICMDRFAILKVFFFFLLVVAVVFSGPLCSAPFPISFLCSVLFHNTSFRLFQVNLPAPLSCPRFSFFQYPFIFFCLPFISPWFSVPTPIQSLIFHHSLSTLPSERSPSLLLFLRLMFLAFPGAEHFLLMQLLQWLETLLTSPRKNQIRVWCKRHLNTQLFVSVTADTLIASGVLTLWVIYAATRGVSLSSAFLLVWSIASEFLCVLLLGPFTCELWMGAACFLPTMHHQEQRIPFEGNFHLPCSQGRHSPGRRILQRVWIMGIAKSFLKWWAS